LVKATMYIPTVKTCTWKKPLKNSLEIHVEIHCCIKIY
jgi:hypothetical protein